MFFFHFIQQKQYNLTVKSKSSSFFPILPFQRSFSPPPSVSVTPSSPSLPEVAVRPAAVAPWVSWPKPRGRRRRCGGPGAPRCRRPRRRRDPPRHPVHREVATGEDDTGGVLTRKKMLAQKGVSLFKFHILLIVGFVLFKKLKLNRFLATKDIYIFLDAKLDSF